jgi:type I restriction enzyme, S subunit
VRGAVLNLALRGALCAVREGSSALADFGRERPREVMAETDHPYALPPSWAWFYLADLVGSITDGDHQAPPKAPSGVPFLTIGNVSSGKVDFTETRFVDRTYFDALDPRRVPAKGDILYTVVGASYGRPVRVDQSREFCVQRHIAIIRPDGTCERDYLFLFLRSPQGYRQATDAITGTAQPTVPLRPLRRFKVPLPPREEQKRIVAKVDALMKMCDELEAKLRLAEQRAAKLAEAAVRELVA